MATFLGELAPLLRPAQQREEQQLQRHAGDFSQPVPPWDRAFRMSALKGSAMQTLAAAGGASGRGVASDFFPLPRVLAGLGELTRRLFGLALTQEEFAAGESWAETAESSVPVGLQQPGGGERSRGFGLALGLGGPSAWAPGASAGLVKLAVRDEASGARLGTVYLDLHQRHGKFGHCAAFTIRCGRRLREPARSQRAACRPDAEASEEEAEEEEEAEGGAYQLPAVALVCNFSAPAGGSAPPLLSYSELEVRRVIHLTSSNFCPSAIPRAASS